MAGPTAAYLTKIQIAPDSSGSAGTYATLGSQTKVAFSTKGEQIDITQLGGAGNRQRLQGLTDADVKIDFLYDNADTAQSTLRTGLSSRIQVWAKVFVDATHGFSLPCVIGDIGYDLDPAGASKCSISLMATGAITTF